MAACNGVGRGILDSIAAGEPGLKEARGSHAKSVGNGPQLAPWCVEPLAIAPDGADRTLHIQRVSKACESLSSGTKGALFFGIREDRCAGRALPMSRRQRTVPRSLGWLGAIAAVYMG